MGFSYKPVERDLDQVRFIIQDTDSSDALFQDEEITFLLAEEGNVLSAAYRAVEILVAKFSREVDQKAGGVSESCSQRMEHYSALLDRLKRRIAIKGALPFAGGLSEAQKETQEQDDDRISPFFTRDLQDYQQFDPDTRKGRVVSDAIQEEESNP